MTASSIKKAAFAVAALFPGTSVEAEAAENSGSPTAIAAHVAATATAEAKPSLVPLDFKVPLLVKTPTFKVVPLGPALVDIDFKAYMSSIEHLQRTFTRSTDWPHANISAADAMRDMETEQARFAARESFAYAVLTPDGSRERGCIYVYPSTVEGYDAVVRLWVTKAEHDAGFDAKLYAWAREWVRTEWPFAKVAYPGRAIDWADWDRLVAAEEPKAAPVGG